MDIREIEAENIARKVMLAVRIDAPNSNFFIHGTEEWKYFAVIKHLLLILTKDYEIKPK